jgi:hypothetical protein
MIRVGSKRRRRPCEVRAAKIAEELERGQLEELRKQNALLIAQNNRL